VAVAVDAQVAKRPRLGESRLDAVYEFLRDPLVAVPDLVRNPVARE
jgi:hypothetical protein